MFFPQWIVAVLLATGPTTGTITDMKGWEDQAKCIEYAMANAPRIADWVRGSRDLTLHDPVAVVGMTCVERPPAEEEKAPAPPDRKATREGWHAPA